MKRKKRFLKRKEEQKLKQIEEQHIAEDNELLRLQVQSQEQLNKFSQAQKAHAITETIESKCRRPIYNTNITDES